MHNEMENQSNVIRYDLEASVFTWEVAQGKIIEAWGFNKQVPGPALAANVGDTMVIRVTNRLAEPTLVHWHGICLEAAMDGTDGAQKPIAPGESFEYRFTVRQAGTFWYHAHANETVQMERGMYGSLVVKDQADPVTDGERVFMIDDMKLSPNNQFSKPGWFAPRMVERHDGRQGETLLINGRENSQIEMHAGQVERWRFVNSSSARYFKLSLGGKNFKVIATDGGLLEHVRTVTDFLIVPGERLDIAAGPFDEGEAFAIESLPYNRGTVLKAKRETFAVVLVGKKRESKAFIPDALRKIEPLAPGDARITRKIKLSEIPNLKRGVDFKINDREHFHDKAVNVGELQVWEIDNTSAMDHPFHLHGFFFQVIEESGKAPEYRAWKDTYNIPPKTKIKIAWMPDNRKGTWMYHCHILEHHAAGMMASFDVVDGSTPQQDHAVQHHHHLL
jgi:FtsP/CotA-like multicopper oxidase with cupredoxin domain